MGRLCQGTIEERIDSLLEAKQGMSDEVLRDGAESALTEMSDEDLLRFVSLDKNRALSET
ncbi:MAG: hypothetical protein HY721_12920 [Planctomycetes bacterium]|nr:hypothetical protein [Planctomycetota bacterium]